MAVAQVGIGQQLVKELRAQVTLLEADLLARSTDVAGFAETLRAEYDGAREAERTAAGFTQWREGRITQAAAAWVLGTVFVRFCEDNGLIEWPFIAGPGERLADAEDRHGKFFVENPTLNDRDWLVAAFHHLSAAHPTAAGLFDERHNPLWELTPSFEAATALIKYWRRSDDAGHIRHDFTGLDTRFLGDLYQDLSEAARKTYALLQTPEFVEEFILDLTLEPAVEVFGLRGLRTIDPASGSGHFLLGIFHRLLAKWRDAEPGTDDWELIRRSLDSVHGCDKNPFATSIARFRLLVAALVAGGERRLDRAPEFPINVAVGDSLLHGRRAQVIEDDLYGSVEPHTYSTEDVNEFVRSCDLLGRASYHVVVGNPPYITVKDRLENQAYRDRYGSCSGKYALSVPFAERLFQLAIRTHGSDRAAGLVGQITANSFMKREFGKKLIEQFFPTVQLTHVIDTSGAYIPGHGTPTVILVGRNHIGRPDDPIRAVLGIRGEPTRPKDPAKALVWSAITVQLPCETSQSEWVNTSNLDRYVLSAYPWSLSGGGASAVMQVIGKASPFTLGDLLDANAGFAGFSGADDAFYLPVSWHRRFGSPVHLQREVSVGQELRDWRLGADELAIVPHGTDGEVLKIDFDAVWARHLWLVKQSLGSIADFGGKTRFESRLPWWSWYRWTNSRANAERTICLSKVATHNHAVLNERAVVTTQHVPAIVAAEMSVTDSKGAVAVLNSSSACFWLKQVCHNKGGGGIGGGIASEDWEQFYEFTGTKLQEFPLPTCLPVGLGRELDHLAQLLAAEEPAALSERVTPTRDRFDTARTEHERLRKQMITLQEDLDWQVYGSYGLLSAAEVAATSSSEAEPLALGERAFEIVLARKQAAGEIETAWFARHGSTPITEIPGHWPEAYREVVQRRIDIIESRRDIALIERPECKRRWASQSWEKKEAEALQTWLLDRCEQPDLWFSLRDGMRQPRPLTVSQLADQFGPGDAVHAVAQLYAADHLGKRDLTLTKILESVVADEHVPYLAALRYKDSGLVTRKEWECTWEMQREEDRTGENLHIPVPPKYKPADFRKPSYWSQRGKLDVPKERFVSYPGASPDSDPTPLLGWAGWDHKDQAQALVNLVNDRTSQAGWDTDRVQPLLAGLAELLPWAHQWHGEFDAEWDGNPAEEYQTYLDTECARRGLTDDDLRGWRPAAPTRGRRPKGTTA